MDRTSGALDSHKSHIRWVGAARLRLPRRLSPGVGRPGTLSPRPESNYWPANWHARPARRPCGLPVGSPRHPVVGYFEPLPVICQTPQVAFVANPSRFNAVRHSLTARSRNSNPSLWATGCICALISAFETLVFRRRSLIISSRTLSDRILFRCRGMEKSIAKSERP